ncbi:MAG TPA: amino acid adenylation domain-containing protein [Luteimonas sp.]|nr:amino acid adenylation domain-containing protein [Luteimonas sp.]
MATPAGLDSVDYDPFGAGALARVAPTTEPQREVWLADKLGAEASLAYNESVLLRMRGALDVDVLASALQSLVDRHDALRSTFGPDGETLCVDERRELPLERIDLSGLDPDARGREAAARKRKAVETAFDLERGPLFRAELLRMGDDEHVLLMTAHHIVCDGWSWWVLVRELATAYARATGHDAPALPQAPSFADYALAQADNPDATRASGDERYWLSRFDGEVPVLELPVDRPRPARRTFASQREDYVFDAALVADVKRLGARRGASLFATLLGGFSALLSRLSGQAQVVVGIPAAGQSVDGNQGLVGHCVNLLPLRFDIDPAQPFPALVDAAQDTLLDAIEHQRYTFGTLLKKLRVERDPGRLPLVSVMFTIDQTIDDDSHGFPGLATEFATNPRTFENFELFVNAVQLDGGLTLECQYNCDMFDRATVRRWMRAYETLLRNAVARGDAALGELSLLDAESMQALSALQPARTPYPAALGMHGLFERQCDRAPTRTALRYKDQALTYAELEARANRIAALLRARGVRAGALVGLALDRGPDMLAAQLAILKAGAGYVPLDPAFPQERLAYMVSDASLAALVTQRDHADRFDLRGRPVLMLDALADELAQASPERVAQDVDPQSVAYVIYTSGSTGKPKGVQVPHGAVVNFVASMLERPGIDADDRLVAVTTLSFDIAVLELFGPLAVGAEVVLADRETAMDGELLSALLRDRGATLMQATPATWRLLIDAGWQGGAEFRVLCGGEPLPPDLARALLARCGQLWNLYGPTETTVWSTCARVEDPARGISIGTPIANTTVWVVDGRGQPCPLGVPGELCIGGDGVTLGYLGRPELTAERFIDDPFEQRAGAKLYRTGDRARWRPDGTLEHLGRLDFQVKVRGYRIELGEIEAALAACPGVGPSVVMVREDRPGDVRLVGYAVPAPGAKVDEQAALEQLRRALPEYMVPQHIVVLAAMPLLPNGKIDRKALPAPDLDARSADMVPPRNDTERAIARSMAQVLGLPKIGIRDNFFSLGGHSLLAAQLTSRLNRELGASLSLRALFDAPTVEGLAGIVSDAPAAPARKPIEPLADPSTAPLSLMQERLWLLEQFTPGQVTYNTPSGHRLRGPLDVDVFSRAFDAMVQRQAVLRTSIGTLGGEAFQVVHDTVATGLLPVVDLGHLPEAEAEAAALADMQVLIDTPFDLHEPPLFRARLYRLADDHHLMLFLVHHVIWDGWSFDLLYADLSAFYAAFLEEREPDLPPLPVSYGDFSAWHREWIEGPEYAAQLEFWRDRLRNEGEPLQALPTDLPRKPGMSGGSRQYQVSLPRSLCDGLHEVALKLDSTVFVTMLTAYFALLQAVSGQRELIVATPVRGRNSDETEHLMGYFTNTLPLRGRIDPERPFAEVLKDVKSVLLDSFANPDIRLEDLMRELSVRSASGGGQMLYHAMFSFQDVRQRNLEWGNVRHSRVELADPGATQDLGLWLVENDGGLAGAVVYNSDTLLESTAAMLASRFGAMLQSLASDPSQTLAELTRFDDGLPARMGRLHAVPTEAAADAEVVAGADTAAPATPLGDDDPLVEQVAAIWSGILGHDRLGNDEDFFALGGHSLQAVQMFHRISRLTGVNLPLATLLEAPTARGLARVFRDAGATLPGESPGTGAHAGRRDPWAPLVPIRAGTEPGAPALFFAHAIGGNVLNYHALAERLPAGMPIYGLQALGLDGLTPPLERIEDMARLYVAEVRKVQPSGPYYLAGGSMGGMIAYEMARQLGEAGEEVAMLALIDTSSHYGRRLREQAAHPPSALQRLRARLRGLSPGQALLAMGRMPGNRLAAARSRRSVADMQRRGEPLPHQLRYAHVEATHLRAYRDYVVQPWPGRVTLFRAAEQDPELGNDPMLGWGGIAGEVEVIDIPGSHRGIVEKTELPPRLAEAIAAARRRMEDAPAVRGEQASPAAQGA